MIYFPLLKEYDYTQYQYFVDIYWLLFPELWLSPPDPAHIEEIEEIIEWNKQYEQF